MKVSDAIPEYEIIAPTEALISWKNNSVTQQVLRIIEEEALTSSQRMGRGETLGDGIVQNTARAVGYVEGLAFAETLFKLGNVVETQEDIDEKDS